jgi:hypothetical protein
MRSLGEGLISGHAYPEVLNWYARPAWIPTAHHGEFGGLFELLPFTDHTGQMLMKLADSPRLNTNHGSELAASWRTPYELTRLDEADWARVEPQYTTLALARAD